MRIAFVASSVVVFMSSLHAATLVVQPGGTFTLPSQAATAAVAGDTILVKAGTYLDNVLVLTPNLTFKTKGKVVIDASLPIGTAGGAGFLVTAANVKIEGFTIRNARTLAADIGDGIRVTAGGTGVTIRKCTLLQSEVNAITITGGANATIDKCIIDGCEIGIALTTTILAKVTKCAVKRAGEACVRLDGTTGTLVDKCTLRFADGFGGIDANEAGMNNDLTIHACTIEFNSGPGIDVVGSNLVVDGCKFDGNVGIGLLVSNTTGVVVRKTTIRHATDDSFGIEFDTVTSGVIEQCTIRDISSAGIVVIGGSLIFIRDSVIRDGGSGEQDGIIASAVVVCMVEDCIVSGFADGLVYHNVSASEIRHCVIKDCREDGIDVTNAEVNPLLINKCTITGCLAEGVDNSGTDTEVRDSKVTKNRIDIANNGMLTLTNTTFSTGGTTTAPQID